MKDDQSWKSRLLKNKLAIGCIVILVIFFMTACLAYLIIPDKTTGANRQIPLCTLQRPGFTQDFLLRRKNYDSHHNTKLYSLLFGNRDIYDYLPFDTIQYEGSELILFYKGREENIDMADVLFSIDGGQKIINRTDSFIYTDINGNNEAVSIKTAKARIMQVHIKKYIYIFGSDKYGRDILSRVILGLRVSLIVGLLAVLVSLSIGVFIGCLGGYFGSYIDRIVMFLINTSWSIPTLLLAFAIIIAMGKGLFVIVLAVGLTMWVDIARIVRGQVMQIKNQLFIKATQVLGFNNVRTIVVHILPNILGPILVISAANFATAILVEAGLSYLGIGLQPPIPSLGNMLKESYAYATGGFVYLTIFPITTIMLLVLSFNLLGTSLRDVFDIKSSK